MTERDPASGGVDEQSMPPAAEPEAPAEAPPTRPTGTPVASSPGLRSRNPRRAPQVAVRPVRAPLSGLRQKLESTAALRESLDAKEAEAQDLRASIDQLRRELDSERKVGVGAPGVAGAAGAATTDMFGTETAAGSGHPGYSDPFAEAEPSRRRPWWVVVLIALIIAVLLLWLASSCTGTTDASSPTTSASPGVANSAAASGDGTGAAAGATGAVAGPRATPQAWPGSAPVVRPPGVPAAGPGIDVGGTFLEVALAEDGNSVDAYESLVLPGERTEPLALQVPSLTNEAQPVVRSLQVELDGVLAKVTGTSEAGFVATPASGTSYTRAVVRYRLSSSIVRATPAKAGRISAVALPLTAPISRAANQPITMHTLDRQVIQIDCPAATSLLERQCANRDPQGGWTATLPASSERPVFYLLAQLAS